MVVVYKPCFGISMSYYVTLTSNTGGHAVVVCADTLTVYTTTSASDVFRPI